MSTIIKNNLMTIVYLFMGSMSLVLLNVFSGTLDFEISRILGVPMGVALGYVGAAYAAWKAGKSIRRALTIAVGAVGASLILSVLADAAIEWALKNNQEWLDNW